MKNLRFLNSTPARILTIALVVQVILLQAVSRQEYLPSAPPLQSFPTQINDWTMKEEGYVDEETRELLQADDLLSRLYIRPSDPTPTSLFIAAFRSQKAGKAPHSPKNCLPGTGWAQESSGYLTISIDGQQPIEVNRYVVSNRESRSVVLYWYQSSYRVVANEYRAKAFVIADSIRYNRTDTALVRIVVPVFKNDDDLATRNAVAFVHSVYPSLREYLPK